jgi:hypothetical protein
MNTIKPIPKSKRRRDPGSEGSLYIANTDLALRDMEVIDSVAVPTRRPAPPQCCPTCRQLIPPDNPFATRSVKSRIYAYVCKHPEGVTGDQIRAHVYADDPDGGAESISIINVHVHQMNKVLGAQGIKIWSGQGRWSNYKMVPV